MPAKGKKPPLSQNTFAFNGSRHVSHQASQSWHESEVERRKEHHTRKKIEGLVDEMLDSRAQSMWSDIHANLMVSNKLVAKSKVGHFANP